MALRAALASVVVVLLLAAPAGADWQPLPDPMGDGSRHHLSGFAISGNAWLAMPRVNYGTKPRLSTDGGATWQDLQSSGGFPTWPHPEREQGISVGPDGAFYFPAQRTIQRVDPATAAATTVYTVPNAQDARVAAPAWDAQGRMWTATIKDDTLEVVRAEGASGVGEAHTVTYSRTQFFPELAWIAGRIYARFGDRTYQLRDGVLQNVSRYGFPVAAIGDRVLLRDGMSPDGGHSFAPDGGPESAVHGDPSLLVKGGRVLQRGGGGVFVPTSLEVPLSVSAIWRTGDRLVAVSDTSRNQVGGEIGEPSFAVHGGPVPPLPETTGPVSEESLAGLRAANELRAQGGLPPLVGDALITRAAESHSQYYTLNPYGSNPHGEQPGTPGFTGESMTERCAAAGTTCDSEIMSPGAESALDAMQGWLVTPFHSDELTDPEAVWAGYGRAGTIATMDFRSWEIVPHDETNGNVSVGGTRIRAPRGEQVVPTGWPSGRQSGPLSWSGNETPNPIEACREAGVTIAAPIAPVVTVRPAASVGGKDFPIAGMRLLRTADGAAVPGCRLGHDFLADDPFAARTEYEVQFDYHTRTPTGELVPQRHTWRFTTGDGVPGDATQRCPGCPQETGPGGEDEGSGTPQARRRNRLRIVTRRVRRGRALVVAVSARRAGRLRVALDPAARGRRTIKRSLRVAAGTRRVRISTRGLRPGIHRLTLRLTAGGRTVARAAATVRVRR